MISDFLLEYINFLFTQQTSVTAKQLFLIASGKRTPSNLFTAEKNELQGLFNSSLQLSKSEWEAYLNRLVQNCRLEENEGRYSVSSSGLEKRNEFITDYPFFNTIETLTFSQTRKEFWSWFVFVCQILSEYSYKNGRYIPYVSDHNKQNTVKKWLAFKLSDTHDLSRKWALELLAYLENIPDTYRYFILDQLTGHDTTGLTRRQLSQKFDVEMGDIDIILTHLMENLHDQIHSLPLMHSLWEEVHAYCNNGLSESAWRSLQLLDKNHTIDQVAGLRKLKENTIKEHIIESVLIDPGKPIQQFVPESVYCKLLELFEADPCLTYKEARVHFEFLDFFWFRLFEIERIWERKCQKS